MMPMPRDGLATDTLSPKTGGPYPLFFSKRRKFQYLPPKNGKGESTRTLETP